MDLSKGGNKNGVISNMWKRCKSLKKGGSLLKTRSLPLNLDQYKVAPERCFPVYVGPEKERFVIKTKYLNHRLFMILLEEAESEFGYHKGPIMLSCKVDHFVNVLMEIQCHKDEEIGGEKRCNFVARSKSNSSCHFLSPPRAIALAR